VNEKLLTKPGKSFLNFGHVFKKSSTGKAAADTAALQTVGKSVPATKRGLPKASDISRLMSLAKPEKMRLFGLFSCFCLLYLNRSYGFIQ